MNWITRIKKASERITTAIKEGQQNLKSLHLNTLAAMVFQLKEKLLNKMEWSAQSVMLTIL